MYIHNAIRTDRTWSYVYVVSRCYLPPVGIGEGRRSPVVEGRRSVVKQSHIVIRGSTILVISLWPFLPLHAKFLLPNCTKFHFSIKWISKDSREETRGSIKIHRSSFREKEIPWKARINSSSKNNKPFVFPAHSQRVFPQSFDHC